MDGDKAIGIADRLLGLIQHWPDAFCMIGGSLFAYLLTLVAERWFLPTVTDPIALRRQQGLTFVTCWLAGGATSSLLWWAWDAADPWEVRILTSTVVSLILAFVYPPLAAYATSKLPLIGSAWAKR